MPQFPPNDLLLSLRLAPFYVALFLIIGFQLPFWPVWLSFKGLTAEEIGIVLSAPVWAKIVFTPLIASLADYFGRRRAPLVLMSGFSLALFQLYFIVDGFLQIFLVALSIGIFISSFSAISDNLVLTLSRTGKVDYPRIRLWGSVSFIAGSFFGGQLLVGRTDDFIPVLLSAAFALLFLSCLLLPEVHVPRSEQSKKGLRRLLKCPPFLIFLAAAGLIQGSYAVLYSAGTLHWQTQGLSDATIGFLWAEGVIVEIILFAFARGLFRSFSAVQLIMLGGAAGLIRWLVMGFSPDVPVLVVVQMLHGVTFATAHLGAMQFIVEKIPLEISARAQGLYSAVSLGLIMGGSLFFSGYLYEAYAAGAYFFMAGGCAIALLICQYLRHAPEKLQL